MSVFRTSLVAALLVIGCSHRGAATIPFVGCPADGQLGPLAPPEGTAPSIEADPAIADQLAYYKGGDAAGVFAPRGWHCQVLYGSTGSSIVVAPEGNRLEGFEPLHLRDAAVEFVSIVGDTSGRFAAARYVSRLFPKVAPDFVERVKHEGLEPPAAFERGPYPNDLVRYSSATRAEFTTPARREGIGTEGDLAASDDEIAGWVVFDPANDNSVSILRVRLKPELHSVVQAILNLTKG